MQMELEYVARELDLKINNRDVSLLEYLEEVDRLLTDPLDNEYQDSKENYLEFNG